MPYFEEYIESRLALYWFKLLHLPSYNPLNKEIDETWYARWHRITYNKETKLNTNEKKSILYTSCRAATQYNIPEIIGFDRNTTFDHWHKIRKFPKIDINKPQYLNYIEEQFTTHSPQYHRDKTLFIFPDGSHMELFLRNRQ